MQLASLPVDTSPPQISCPLCGADVQVQLGIAPGVVWQAARLQTARPGVIAFCAECDSYFVFGPGTVSEELEAASGEQLANQSGAAEEARNEHEPDERPPAESL